MAQQTREAEYTETRSPEVRREVQVETERDRSPRFGLSLPQILAGALAAASAAVAASWLGVAGTVVGAVVASVVVSVTSALYSHPLERSSQVIREVLPQRPYPYRDDSESTETRIFDASAADEAIADGNDTRSTRGTADATTVASPDRRISWKAVAASSAAILVIGLGMLTAVEALTGGSVGPSGGGTTLSRIVKGDDSHAGGSNGDQPSSPSQTDDPGNTTPTTDQPTDSPSTDEPTTTDPTNPDPTSPTPTQPTQTQPTPGASTGGVDSGGADGAADSNPLGATSSL